MRHALATAIVVWGILGLAAAQAPAVDPTPRPAPAPAPAPTPPKPDPAPAPAPEAKAIITLWNGQPVPATWPVGFSIGLSSATSVAGSKAKSVRWRVDPAWIDPLSQRGPDGRTISVGTGTKPKTITVSLMVAAGDTFDESSATIQVVANPEEPDTPPSPTPAPTPGPAPAPPVPTPAPDGTFDPNLVPVGAAYAKALAAGLAKAMEDGAKLLDAGQGRTAATNTIASSFKANRAADYEAIVTPALAKVVPEATADADLTADQRAALAKAFRGLKLGLGGSK